MKQLPLDVSGILSVWVETLLYGVYCSLFFESVFIIIKKKKFKTWSARIFFGTTIAMFVVASAHMAINLYRMLRGYVWLAEDPGPAAYFGDLQRWDNITHDTLNAVITWMGDSLVIFRCFIIWDRNIYIVILPIILVFMSVIGNSIALHQFAHLDGTTIFAPSLIKWMDTIYALAFVQNFMTTSLIAYRVWSHDRASRGIMGKNMSLLPILRIMIESASIYLLTVLILIVLYALGNNGQYIVQEAFVPIVGIVFTLITVRLAMHSSRALRPTEAVTQSIRFNDFRTTTSGTRGATGTTHSTNVPSDSDTKAIPTLDLGSKSFNRTNSIPSVKADQYDIPMEDMFATSSHGSDEQTPEAEAKGAIPGGAHAV